MRDYSSEIEQQTLFLKMLPELKKSLGGRWVIFTGGSVKGDFDSEDEAFEAAVKTCRADDGYLIIRVESIEPIPITASVLFSHH